MKDKESLISRLEDESGFKKIGIIISWYFSKGFDTMAIKCQFVNREKYIKYKKIFKSLTSVFVILFCVALVSPIFYEYPLSKDDYVQYGIVKKNKKITLEKNSYGFHPLFHSGKKFITLNKNQPTLEDVIEWPIDRDVNKKLRIKYTIEIKRPDKLFISNSDFFKQKPFGLLMSSPESDSFGKFLRKEFLELIAPNQSENGYPDIGSSHPKDVYNYVLKNAKKYSMENEHGFNIVVCSFDEIEYDPWIRIVD